MTVAADPFASIPIPLPAIPGGSGAVTFRITPGEFAMGPSKSVWLRLDDGTAGSTGPDLGLITGTVKSGKRLISKAAPTIALPGNAELVRVGIGTYSLDVGPIGLANPPGSVEFSLAGDANGTNSVNAASIKTIGAELGKKAGSPDYKPAADINNDGVINAADLKIARSNLGRSTTVRPLGISIATATSPLTAATITRTIQVTTSPGAEVAVSSANPYDPATDTGARITGAANASGVVEVSAGALTTSLDTLNVNVEAVDTFGQYSATTAAVPNALGEGFGEIFAREPAYNPDLGSPASEWKKALPTSVDLSRGADVPPVYNQGALNSCTSNALAWDYRYVEGEENLANPIDPSRAFLYYNGRVTMGQNPVIDDGSYNGAVLSSMVNVGVAPESAWPVTEPVNAAPSAQAYAEAQAHKVLADYQLNNTNLAQLKGSLAAGYPFTIAVQLTSSFDSNQDEKSGQVMTPQYGEPIEGGHAIDIVGYDDATQQFKFVNSWGTNWGASGYGYIPYSYVTSTFADGIYSIRRVS